MLLEADGLTDAAEGEQRRVSLLLSLRDFSDLL